MDLEEIKEDLKKYRRPKYKGFIKPPSDKSIENTLIILDQLTRSGLNFDHYSAMADGGVGIYVSFGEDTYNITVENNEDVLVLTILADHIDDYRYLEFFSIKGLVHYLTKNIN